MNGHNGELLDLEQAEYDALSPAKKDYYQQFRAFMPDIDFDLDTKNLNNQTKTIMPLIAEAKPNTYKSVPAGNHIARCIRVIDLGTQHGSYEGKPNVAHKLMLMFELPECTMEYEGETKFMVISKEYTLSLGEKATLRKELQSWRGKDFTDEELKGFDIFNLLNKTCMLNIVHKTSKDGKVRSNIASLGTMHKSLVCPEAENPCFTYEVSEGHGGRFADLPKWIQDKINESDEIKGVTTTEAVHAAEFETAGVDNDEPPF